MEGYCFCFSANRAIIPERVDILFLSYHGLKRSISGIGDKYFYLANDYKQNCVASEAVAFYIILLLHHWLVNKAINKMHEWKSFFYR